MSPLLIWVAGGILLIVAIAVLVWVAATWKR